MKAKRFISMFLSLAMSASCLVAVPFTAQASEVVAPLANIIPQGDMEDDTVSFSTTGAKSFETDPALTGDENNKVLKIDGNNPADSVTKLTIKSLTPMTAGRTYYIDFDYKVNYTTHVRVRNASFKAAIIGTNGDANAWYKLSENLSEGYTNVITPTEDTYYQDITVGNNLKGKELYIDNLAFYDITDAVEITTNTDDSVKLVAKDGLQTIDGKLMANKGSVQVLL